MKATLKALLVLSMFSLIFTSCKKEEDDENELHIDFKTGTGYTSTDTTLASGTAVKIGVEAETEKAKDPIISFNISESINGGSAATVKDSSISTTVFSYDYDFVLNDTVSGNTHRYIFTITNRDGFNKQASLTVTVQ